MSDKPIVAIMYDFDKTLCTKDMQDYTFIPSLSMQSSDFWAVANGFGRDEHMDSILAYMYTMIKKSSEKNIPLLRETLVNNGKDIEFYKGVTEWFDRINQYGAIVGVSVEHYIISSGLKEIIEGSSISDKFKEIFACEFYYDETGHAVWPKTAVNYTNKTQFVYRINKGVLDVANDVDLNSSMPDDSKRVPFSNMIYIGDGLSDVPCMKMMKAYGGESIAVYNDANKEKVEQLLLEDRVDYIFPADYSKDSGLDKTMKNILRKMAIENDLSEENSRQLKSIEN
ncbi:MAG: haloacid dehalogenase-like hydrolase [Ruminococcus sp.]|nr:haloacid dehalogenase-like hydrolase [Ruminococcus sp.]